MLNFIFSCFSFSFQVFRNPKVGSKAKDEMITSGESSPSLLVFIMLYFIEGIVLFMYGGTTCGRINFGFL